MQQTTQPQTLNNVKVNRSKATLIIMSPRKVGTIHVRPHLYKFDENLGNEIASCTDLNSFFRNEAAASESVKSAIIPSAQGIPINMSTLDSCYTFVLTVDRTVNANAVVGTQLSRHVYIGYFSQEPFGRIGPSGEAPLNPEALMIFTHCKSLMMGGVVGASGGNNMAIPGVYDITPPSIVSGADVDLYAVDPAAIASGYSVDGNRNLTTNTHAAYLGGGAPKTVDACLSAPSQHFGVLLDKLHSARLQSYMDTHNPLKRITGADYTQTVEDSFVEGLVQTGMRVGTGILDPTRPLRLRSLEDAIGQYEVVAYTSPESLYNDNVDTGAITPQNVMSSLVSDTVKAIASYHGISDIAFAYKSRVASSFGLHSKSAIRIEAASPIVAMTQEAWQAVLFKFTQELENNLFPIIESSVGAFDVFVSYNACGKTTVSLILIDQGQLQPEGQYVTNNTLGGLISPYIGTESSYLHNSQQVAALSTYGELPGAYVDDIELF